MKKMYIIGGGTVNKIAPHLQLCSYASGNTADELMGYTDFPNFHNLEKKLILTRMAQGNDSLYTVDQLRRFIEAIYYMSRAGSSRRLLPYYKGYSSYSFIKQLYNQNCVPIILPKTNLQQP